jgi:pimeloyl-ACP methyl ester carboxylesterase
MPRCTRSSLAAAALAASLVSPAAADVREPTPVAPRVESGASNMAPAPARVPSPDVTPTDLPTRVPVPGDRPVQVAHAARGDRRAILYLHGVCGRVEAFRAFERAAVHFGTVIALLGDAPCEGTGRSSWGPDVARIDARVTAALRAVGEVRGEPLDASEVTVMGYSQGSLRAAALARRFPTRYRRLVIAASPTTPTVDGLASVRAALVGGGLDRRQHLFEAARAFRAAGAAASYFELPGARHGEYGPDAERAMGEVFAWLFAP